MKFLKSAFARILNRRIRIAGDTHPYYDRIYDDRFCWMQLNNLKVSPAIYDQIKAKRNIPDQFSAVAGHRLAIIIPYRNRAEHLRLLLPELNRTVAAQGIDHRVFVIEQLGSAPFNRARLLNIGAAVADESFDYFCFHDVDTIPVDSCYGYPSAPLRLVSTVRNPAGQRSFSNIYFSGAISVTRTDFIQVNGFSNEFWHWGKEDDNFLLRLLLAGKTPAIDSKGVFDEVEASTDRDTTTEQLDKQAIEELKRGNRKRQQLAATGKLDAQTDGLSTLEYSLVEAVSKSDHMRISVEL